MNCFTGNADRVNESDPGLNQGSAGNALAGIRAGRWNEFEMGETAIPEVPGMLSKPERRLLHWLARDFWQGLGCIVDAGCFLGGSTLAFASGLDTRAKRSGQSPPTGSSRRLHSYDLFILSRDPYALKLAGSGKKPGDSIRADFERWTAAYEDYFELHAGDIRQMHAPAESIEILFIDIAKSWDIHDYLLENFFPKVLVGSGIVVQQDFRNPWVPWIPLTMELLRPWLEPLRDEWESRVYRLIAPIPVEIIRASLRSSLSREGKLALMDAAIARESEEYQIYFRASKAVLLFIEGSIGEAREQLAKSRILAGALPWAQKLFDSVAQTIEIWADGAAFDQHLRDKFAPSQIYRQGP